MTKLYYDDALIAAYMMREFGVIYNNYDNIDEILSDFQHKSDIDKMYIYPDSLDVFNPTADDLMRRDVGMDGEEYDSEYDIIQRNGKQFFMPKVVQDD